MKNMFSFKPSIFQSSVCSMVALVALQSAVFAKEDLIRQVFPVKPNGTLTMKVDRGNIKIKTADISEATVEVRREVKKGPDSLLEEHKVELSQKGNEIIVAAQSPSRQKSWSFFKGEQFHVSYLVTIPKDFNVNTRTSGGSIQLADLDGRAECRTAGGNIEIAAVNGLVVAQTSGGSISLTHATESADLGTAGGNIKVATVDGDLVAKTSGGSIHVQNARGKTLLQTSGGNIRIDDASGELNASTSGGSITAQLSKAPEGETTLKTSGGNVTLALPSSATASINAQTSGGEVRTTFPDTNRKNRSKLQMDLNGGGAKITLETSGGSVNLNKI